LPAGASERASLGQHGEGAPLLPASLEVLWRTHVSFGLLELLVAHDGRLVATTPNQELVELDPRGQRLGAVALEGMPMAACILADGTRVVASDRGRLLGFDDRGAPRFEVEPGWTRLGEPTRLLPLPLGGFAAASLRRLVWYQNDGTIQAVTALDEAVLGLAFIGRDLAVVLRSGTVLRWDGQSEPQSLGDFGAALQSLPIVHDGRLVALTADAAVAKDPSSGRNHALASGLDIAADTLPFTLHGEVAWLGSDNALVRLDPEHGASKLPLGPETTELAAKLRPISDGRGNAALVNAMGELTLVRASGQVVTDSEVRCSTPIALLPQRPGRLVLACRTGAIWAFGD
jgi:hypothetical protein